MSTVALICLCAGGWIAAAIGIALYATGCGGNAPMPSGESWIDSRRAAGMILLVFAIPVLLITIPVLIVEVTT